MRTIGIVTVARSDYGIYRSLLDALSTAPDLRLRIFAAGMHLSPEFGATASQIEADGFQIDERIEMLLSSDSPEGIAKSTGLGVIGFSQAFARTRPDVLVVLGDRFEMFSAALAALPFKIPVAHIHGGETTFGAIDEALRHAMTKLSHLHFVSTEDYAARVVQLGEEPWRVTVCGAPALDALDAMTLLTREELESHFHLRLDQPPLLVTFHPVTLEYEQAIAQTGELLAALEATALPLVFTAPNADTCGRAVATLIHDYIRLHPNAQFVENFGQRGYFSMMREAAAMVGNSSSGIIEAASFHLPVVNVGNRQAGRMRGRNVIDVPCSRSEIAAAIQEATSASFREAARRTPNPYRAASGDAASLIVEKLRSVPLDDRLMIKRFHDLKPAVPENAIASC